jgi:hypothetical protein
MEHNVIVGSIPWPVACLTAVWFGVMAYKAGKNAVLWAIGGGVLGLVTTTIVLGLAQAVFIPMAADEITPYRIKAASVAVVVVFCLGWLFAGSLHPHLFAPWKRSPEPVKETAVNMQSKPPGDPKKT